MKSFLHSALEAIIAEKGSRFDHGARDRRVMASVIIECATHGYTDAKMIDIATRARVSTKTLYQQYGDRDALFIAAIEMALTILSQGWRPSDLPTHPIQRLSALLLSHGQAWSDPFIGWIIRMYIIYANGKAPHLLALGQAARASNMSYWHDEIGTFETTGLIDDSDRATKIAIILGAIERRTIFARLGFGENDHHSPDLETVAEHTALAFFQVYGTGAFWQRFGTEIGQIPARARQTHIALPQFKMDPPSNRLRAYAERVFASDYDRLDVQGRRVRVQLAAMLVCLRDGYENATMANVAETAKVSTATLYMDYADKQTLFLDAMILQARFRVDYSKLIAPDLSAGDNMAALVFSIASVLADPDFLWYHYVAMASELSASPQLIASSRETRAHTEGFWLSYFDILIKEGVLVPHDTMVSMNLLLGATQRRSVQSLVLFGKDDVSQEELAHLAVASTAFVLQLYGASTEV
jgi:AcrR family transcriptional regulator